MKGFILMIIVVLQFVIYIITKDAGISYLLLLIYVVVNSSWELAKKE